MDVVERRAEAQRKQLRQAKDNLSIAKVQIKVLTKKLEEAEKAKEQAEQDGYDMGVVETKDAFRAEFSKVYRFYCFPVWNEALDWARVEVSSALRRAENVYYPPAIGAWSSKADSVSKEADEGKESPNRALPTTNISSVVVEQSMDVKKVVDTTKEVA